ncbi:uncharacterized protein LOC111625222 [Centruroides sculpturatus]|uniref:uncharacterized protein LOC111625222 n=1 Tax=Centruroides sculpturatus TaxID=218467 RepID=UPI000C6E4BC6|nr:uncharacterized protein LOC111625222 [Centruroides sculpturatus]
MSQTDTKTQAESKFNTAFIKTRYGILRIAQFVIAICGIISVRSGYYCYYDVGKYNYYEIVFIGAIVVLIIFFILIFFKLDKYLIGRINLPLSFLISDVILTVKCIIISILLLVSINTCYYGVTARIFASIFGIMGFVAFLITSIEDYNWFKSRSAPIPLSEVSGGTVQHA